MSNSQEYGPFSVSISRVDTGIQVESGNVVRTQSTGLLDLGGAFLGLGQVILGADGDSSHTPASYPAPDLSKNSLIFQVGDRWYQGGTNAAVECITSGTLILFVNDDNPSDNSRAWQVHITVISLHPSPFQGCEINLIRQRTGFLGDPSNVFGNFQSEGWTENFRGRYKHYEKLSLYWSPETGCHEVHGDIRVLYQAMGWERSYLQYPTTDETPTPDGVGRFNHFTGGSIYWTPQTHAHAVKWYIRDKWGELGYERGYLRYPVTDTINECGDKNRFQGGVIYGGFRVDLPNYINRIYELLGGPCALGLPENKYLLYTYSGFKLTFSANKAMYWSARTGAHIVLDRIYHRYREVGEEHGSWGYPIGDQVSGPVIYQVFEHGTARFTYERGFEFTSGLPHVITTPPSTPGVRNLELYNCHTERHTVSVWINDITSGRGWQRQGDALHHQYSDTGSCPVPGATPVSIPFENGHIYEIVVTDPEGLACTEDDPNILGCRRNYYIFGGDSSGRTQTEFIS